MIVAVVRIHQSEALISKSSGIQNTSFPYVWCLNSNSFSHDKKFWQVKKNFNTSWNFSFKSKKHPQTHDEIFQTPVFFHDIMKLHTLFNERNPWLFISTFYKFFRPASISTHEWIVSCNYIAHLNCKQESIIYSYLDYFYLLFSNFIPTLWKVINHWSKGSLTTLAKAKTSLKESIIATREI